jgi:hypothetical protein
VEWKHVAYQSAKFEEDKHHLSKEERKSQKHDSLAGFEYLIA